MPNRTGHPHEPIGRTPVARRPLGQDAHGMGGFGDSVRDGGHGGTVRGQRPSPGAFREMTRMVVVVPQHEMPRLDMPVPRVAADTSADEVEAALRAAGCVVVERLIPDSLVDAINAELDPFIAATPEGGDGFAGLGTKRTGALLARSVRFATSRSTRRSPAHSIVCWPTTRRRISCISRR